MKLVNHSCFLFFCQTIPISSPGICNINGFSPHSWAKSHPVWRIWGGENLLVPKIRHEHIRRSHRQVSRRFMMSEFGCSIISKNVDFCRYLHVATFIVIFFAARDSRQTFSDANLGWDFKKKWNGFLFFSSEFIQNGHHGAGLFREKLHDRWSWNSPPIVRYGWNGTGRIGYVQVGWVYRFP